MVKWYISDFKIPAQVWHWEDGSNDTKSHIALRKIFCLCVVEVKIFLTSEASQQNYRRNDSLTLTQVLGLKFTLKLTHTNFDRTFTSSFSLPNTQKFRVAKQRNENDVETAHYE
ncbi:hypothetical protein PV328_007854 [Microctonus aethiopoides]|uniref:Uncharacterized protein n=1 Tax=Microctonus aethiopoides TaxID=144406 RepID=A0AA39CA86_9HYME|nr:hypothetical protein PV328_007854 [Microctonus aethiopoides]